MFCKIDVLKNFAKSTCAKASFLINFIKKETLAQVLSCEFCEIFKNIYFYRTPLVAASGVKESKKKVQNLLWVNSWYSWRHVCYFFGSFFSFHLNSAIYSFRFEIINIISEKGLDYKDWLVHTSNVAINTLERKPIVRDFACGSKFLNMHKLIKFKTF